MLYKFKSKAGGDVIMTGPHGDQLLRLLGREPAAQGILLPQDLPPAIAALEAAVAAEELPVDDDAQPRPIGLRQRAWPLLEMMKRARAQDKEIVWGV
jgi:Domain of unknown function (DUF1840)